MTWREDIFDNLVRLQRGFDLPESRLVPGPYPVVASTQVTAFHKEGRVKGPGVVTGRSGSLGAVQFIPGDFWPLNTALYARDFKGNDPKFVFYFLKEMHLENFNAGAGVPTLNQNHLHKLRIRIPPLPTQRKIAAVLSAYDEAIENNRRRIGLLEKMAEELYREWFVRLRFPACAAAGAAGRPGHEKVKAKKGVPEGWRIAELRELAVVNPASTRKRSGSILYVDIGSVTTHRINEMIFCADADAPGRARRHVQHGDIIWSAVRPGNRAFCLVYEPPANLIVSTGFAVIRPRHGVPFSFLLFTVTTNAFVEQMVLFAKGAAYPATSFDDFEKARLLVPAEEMLHLFDAQCEPLLRQKHLLCQQNVLLSATRDRLLPRLVSGRLGVERVEDAGERTERTEQTAE